MYATIQRKQPPVPPFTTDTPASRKGFDTNAERLKRLNNGEAAAAASAAMAMAAASEMCPYMTTANPNLKNNFKTNGYGMGGGRCATLGRMKNLEMTEYQRQKFINGTNADVPMVKMMILPLRRNRVGLEIAFGTYDIVTTHTERNFESTRYFNDLNTIIYFLFQDLTKEYTLSLGRNHKLRRKPYSESEEYDTDTSGDTRNEILSRTTAESSNQHLQEMRNNINRYGALRYRQQFDL